MLAQTHPWRHDHSIYGPTMADVAGNNDLKSSTAII